MKLGIIGISEGNGHPYSWSAIINGYNKKKMEECKYESIPSYLKRIQIRSAKSVVLR